MDILTIGRLGGGIGAAWDISFRRHPVLGQRMAGTENQGTDGRGGAQDRYQYT